MTEPRTVVGLDIGNHKVVAVAATISSDGVANIQGRGITLSRGMKNGAVVDLEAVENAVRNAIAQTESMINGEINGVIISISGEHIGSLNEDGKVVLSGAVNANDIKAALNLARSVRLDEDVSIIHSLAQEYLLDNVPCRSPMGLSGVRLNAQVHLVTCNRYWQQNLVRAVERCKLKVDDVIFSGYASSYSVLTEDEKERGVCLVDIGAGTMDMVVYTEGVLRFSKSIPLGGNNVTEYIATGLYTSLAEAESIKINYGSAISPPSSGAELKFEVAGTGVQLTRHFTRAELSQWSAAYYQYLFETINFELNNLRKELADKHLKMELIAGLVLTGGGSQIKDILECATKVCGLQARLGHPLNISGLTELVQGNKAQYATVLGLLQHLHQRNEHQQFDSLDEQETVFEFGISAIKKAYHLVKKYF